MLNTHFALFKCYLYTVCLFFLITVAGLWSWNTLSELFNGPLMQYRHVLVVSMQLLIIKWVFSKQHSGPDLVSGSYPNHLHW